MRRYTTHLKNLLLALMAIILFSNCSDKDNGTILPPPTPDFIHTTKVELAGLAEEDAHTVTFESPAPWTAEIHSSGDWLKADKTHGNAGPVAIALSARTDNFGATSRLATLEIYIDGYNAYTIEVEQKPAAATDIKVTGHIDGSVMTLRGDRTGTIFTDTFYVTANKEWYLVTDEGTQGKLSFQTDGTPQTGVEKTIRVIVTAEYASFENTSLTSVFSIRTKEGTALPITVNAVANASVYEQEQAKQGEEEKVSFVLTDEQRRGTYSADLYIESNVRWIIDEKPIWLETSADWSGEKQVPTNVNANGEITQGRHHISLRVKPDYINATGRAETISIKDAKGQVLKTLYLVFAGAGQDYTSYTLSFPATDNEGNPWAFEAKQKTVEEEGPYNRKRINMDFLMTTAADYNNIKDAPFHLLMVDATNGIAHKKQVHWATLRMGDASQSTTTVSGMYVKQLLLEANERGDEDDVNAITTPTDMRNAFVYIVPRSVSFEDLWEDEYTLKEQYADDLKLIAQKNDPDALYTFSFNELADGATINIAPQGETKVFTVKEGSYLMLDYVIEAKNNEGEWEKASYCTIETNDRVSPIQIALTFSENKPTVNPFTGEVMGEPRQMRIRFDAFIEDGLSKTIYTIYANQDLMP